MGTAPMAPLGGQQQIKELRDKKESKENESTRPCRDIDQFILFHGSFLILIIKSIFKQIAFHISFEMYGF